MSRVQARKEPGLDAGTLKPDFSRQASRFERPALLT